MSVEYCNVVMANVPWPARKKRCRKCCDFGESTGYECGKCVAAPQRKFTAISSFLTGVITELGGGT
jgi:hypothetical protein